MLSFFNTRDRLRFLLMVGAIAAPILLGAAFLVTWMEADGAANGTPNAKGGLHYRLQNANGVTSRPQPLIPLSAPYPGGVLVDVDADTDAASALTSAAIMGRTKDSFAKVAAFYAGQLDATDSKSDSLVSGKKGAYEVTVTPDGTTPSGETRFSYYVSKPK